MSKGLPLHLEPYTLSAPRTESKPKGERQIDHRLQVSSSSNNTQLQLTSSGSGTIPDLRAKLSVKTSGSKPDNQTEENVTIQVSSKEPPPADTEKENDTPEVVVVPDTEEKAAEKIDATKAVYACKDVRQKQWNAQRELIKSALLLFQQDRASNAGTKELARYMRSKLVNKFARKELLPVKMNRINDDEMERIISRCAGLSTYALAPVVPLPGATVDSDSEQSDSEPYYEGKDNEDEDMMDESDSLILQVSDHPEFMT